MFLASPSPHHSGRFIPRLCCRNGRPAPCSRSALYPQPVVATVRYGAPLPGSNLGLRLWCRVDLTPSTLCPSLLALSWLHQSYGPCLDHLAWVSLAGISLFLFLHVTFLLLYNLTCDQLLILPLFPFFARLCQPWLIASLLSIYFGLTSYICLSIIVPYHALYLNCN